MLRAMIQLAPRSEGGAGTLPDAVRELRGLAEFPDVGERAYVLTLSASGELTAQAHEVDAETRYGFPFRRPSGPRSPQVGPVLKRAFDPKKGVTPNATTLAATLTHFEAIASSTEEAGAVYRRCLDALGADASTRVDRVAKALASITEKKTVFVSLGSPPGNDPAYAAHLLSVIREELYGIDETSPIAPCPACGRTMPLGATALKGAKVNFLNMDNHGVFAGFDAARAGDRFALCAPCADAIARTYINLKDDLRVVIAGAPALLLPYVHLDGAAASQRSAWDVLSKAREAKGTAAAERDLLDVLAEEGTLASFHILWATAGDSLDDVTGLVTDVPCTRLGALSKVNLASRRWTSPVFPARRVCDFDLKLSLVAEVLRHPGGKRVDRRNGQHLAALRRTIARGVYLGAPIAPSPLFSELRDIIADHLVDPTVDERFLSRNLTREPDPPKKVGAPPYLNAASWARHAALLIHYLRHLEVLPAMSNEARYVPRSERLRALLAPPSGVDRDATMFAFILGVLFGRLLVVQSARGVNARSNALTWLRRATLTGDDLPDLYVKVREKLAEYESERDPRVREVIFDLSALGARLGAAIPLDANAAMYFLFLGQALAGEVFPKDDDKTTTEPR
ncbi:MAG: TM1802 family CRISPR-associated protein [Polyangiales bacterium]